jgi:hypothetical protein
MSRASAARLLGVTPDASAAQVDHVFRAYARAHHPDLFAPESVEARAATIVMRELSDARRVLLLPGPTAPGPNPTAPEPHAPPRCADAPARSAPRFASAPNGVTTAPSPTPRPWVSGVHRAVGIRPVAVGASLIAAGMLLAWLR